jgi:hypothetical protein
MFLKLKMSKRKFSLSLANKACVPHSVSLTFNLSQNRVSEFGEMQRDISMEKSSQEAESTSSRQELHGLLKKRIIHYSLHKTSYILI